MQYASRTTRHEIAQAAAIVSVSTTGTSVYALLDSLHEGRVARRLAAQGYGRLVLGFRRTLTRESVRGEKVSRQSCQPNPTMRYSGNSMRWRLGLVNKLSCSCRVPLDQKFQITMAGVCTPEPLFALTCFLRIARSADIQHVDCGRIATGCANKRVSIVRTV